MPMKAYLKEIPGRVHEMKEDAACSSFITDSDGTAWGLFMVADGLSGYAGIIASNVAVRSILYTITDALQKPDSKKYTEIIKSSIIKAHERLEHKGDTFTTLSLALASEDDLYIAHLGDGCVRLVYEDTSIIITPEENKGGIPSNYLGKAFLSDKPITERINLFQPYREGKKKPLGLQLETDGLISRLTETEITEILLKAKEYDEPSTILQMYEQRVIIPERRLLELPAGKLKRYLKDVPNFSIPEKLSPEEVVRYVISAYRLRDNTELANIIDNSLLKYDDTTVIYVDLQDTVRKSLDALLIYEKSVSSVSAPAGKTRKKKNVPAGREEELVARSAAAIRSLEIKVQKLQQQNGEQEQKSQLLLQEREATLQRVVLERDTYQRERAELSRELGAVISRLPTLKSELENYTKREEKSTELLHQTEESLHLLQDALREREQKISELENVAAQRQEPKQGWFQKIYQRLAFSSW